MFVTVTKLRRNGLRLKREEREQPLKGHLSTSYRAADQSGTGRAFQLMELFQRQGGNIRCLGSLLDPHFVSAESRYFVFKGYEVESRDQRLVGHVQVWLISPAIEFAGSDEKEHLTMD